MIFGRSNNAKNIANFKESEDTAMFNMQQVGSNICMLRKSIGITQMELADKLGISFQAVSNWERGLSMPDISKLGELSELFKVSIDEILGNSGGVLDGKRTSAIAESLLENRPVTDVTMEEIEEIAPILHEDQVETLLNRAQENKPDLLDLDLESVVNIAPFLSQELVDSFAKALLERTQSLESIEDLAPFVSASVIEEKALEVVRKTGDLKGIEDVAYMLNKSFLSELADMAWDKTKDLKDIEPILPFLGTQKIDECAMKAYSAHGIGAIEVAAPFMSDKIINEIAKESLEKKGLSSLEDIMPFIDKKIVEDYIKKFIP